MYNINDYVVYKKDVCKIKDIKTNEIDKYYVLMPVSDESLLIDVPYENKLGLIRPIISLKVAKKIVELIPTVEPIKISNDKLLENEYKKLLYSGTYEDLIRIIKTTYNRNKARADSNRKIGEKDDAYFKKAERFLYNELAIAYNLSFDEMKDYIVKNVEKMTK